MLTWEYQKGLQLYYISRYNNVLKTVSYKSVFLITMACPSTLEKYLLFQVTLAHKNVDHFHHFFASFSSTSVFMFSDWFIIFALSMKYIELFGQGEDCPGKSELNVVFFSCFYLWTLNVEAIFEHFKGKNYFQD